MGRGWEVWDEVRGGDEEWEVAVEVVEWVEVRHV